MIVSYSNPRDLMGGAEQIAWAEAELLRVSRRVLFLSASAPIKSAPFPQHRIAAWTRRLYHQSPDHQRRNVVSLGVFHLLSLFNPVALVEALWLFRRLRPKVVHTHNLLAISPAVWLAARLSGAQVIHTHHDLWLLCERATMTDSWGRPCEEARPTCCVCRMLRSPKRIQFRLVSTEIFPSRWLRGRLGRRGDIVQSFSTTYQPTRGDPGTPPSTVAYVGALTPHKLGALLQAFALVPPDREPPVRLAIAGSGPQASEVARACERDSRIEYLGPLDSAARDRMLDNAALLVIPSTWPENSPLVFFEALAAGLPVIASDIGGLSELHGFGNVLLVPPGDAEALAEALLALFGAEEPLAQLRVEALRQRPAASPARYSEAVEGVLEQLHRA